MIKRYEMLDLKSASKITPIYIVIVA